jgi:coenzyme F420-reducing hydrogenase beta subunit
VSRERINPKAIIGSGLCIGCGICTADEPKAAMRWDKHGQLKPTGPRRWMRRGSPNFSRICPFSPLAANETEIAEARFPAAAHDEPHIGRHEAAFVGHVAQQGFRERGSSGGMVSWVAAQLLRRGLVDGVVHVAANPQGGQPLFGYRISRKEEDVRAGAKSRYHPVQLGEALREIRATPGRYAVVGVPCFIKAVHLLCREDPLLRERVAFTLGLFCGHMKSARMAESFAWQMDIAPEEIAAIDYRLKNPDRPANWYTAHVTARDGACASRDWWRLVDGDWGAGFFQNTACNFCDDVVAETADISFGDAWVEPYSSDGRGTNVVVVRSQLLHRLLTSGIARGSLDLKPVDADFVVETQAAGFRHRREGLAYRLSWRRRGIRPRKRVEPRSTGIARRRKFIYIMRHGISAWSHRMFAVARIMRQPAIYTSWARAALAVYHGLAYSRGRAGKIADLAENFWRSRQD